MIDKKKLVDDLIEENEDSTIKDYIELLQEIEEISKSFENGKSNPS